MADSITTDMKESVLPANRIADGLMVAMRDHDPVEAICALAIVTSHFIVTVGLEGTGLPDGHARLQVPTQAKLLDRVTELCQEVRRSGAN